MIVYDPRFLDHVQPAPHPERPDRLRAIVDRLTREGLFDAVDTAPAATQEDLARVHRLTYLDYVRDLREGFLDVETEVRPATWEIAVHAAGAVLHATRLSVREGRSTIALVRPPGHHAGPDYGGGFCYLNNVAVAAADQAAQGKRVAILDYDGHHGNGTRDIFAETPSVLYVSTHEFGIYPGTGPAEDVGTGDGAGYTANIPFPAGSGDASYRAAHEALVAPLLKQFRPDAILVSLGIDAHYLDPLTSLTLSSPGYVDLVARAAGLARDVCGGRFVVALEGGYDLGALSEVFAGIAARERGRSIALALTEVRDTEARGQGAIDAALRALRPYWHLG